MTTTTETLKTRGWTDEDIRTVKAAFIGSKDSGTISLSPGRFLPRDEWDAMKIDARELLPDGATVTDDLGFSATIEWQTRATIALVADGQKAWSGSVTEIAGLVRDQIRDPEGALKIER